MKENIKFWAVRRVKPERGLPLGTTFELLKMSKKYLWVKKPGYPLGRRLPRNCFHIVPDCKIFNTLLGVTDEKNRP